MSTSRSCESAIGFGRALLLSASKSFKSALIHYLVSASLLLCKGICKHHITFFTSFTTFCGISTSCSCLYAVARRVTYGHKVLRERRGPSIPLCSVASILKKLFMQFAFGTNAGWSIRNVNLLLSVSSSSHSLDAWNPTLPNARGWTYILYLLEGQLLVDVSLLIHAAQYLPVVHPLRASYPPFYFKVAKKILRNKRKMRGKIRGKMTGKTKGKTGE